MTSEILQIPDFIARVNQQGGTAYPAKCEIDDHSSQWLGMTLRDWFAGQALAGMLAHSTRYRPREGTPANWHEAIGEEAYQIADAMIEARKQ